MTSMRRRYVASTSLRHHVPAGNLAPTWPPQYSKPSYAYDNYIEPGISASGEKLQGVKVVL